MWLSVARYFVVVFFLTFFFFQFHSLQFDHLHAGHKLLLSASVALTTDKLTIGLTGSFTSLRCVAYHDVFFFLARFFADKSLCTQKKFVEFMQEYDDRAEAVARFVEMLNPNVDVKVRF